MRYVSGAEQFVHAAIAIAQPRLGAMLMDYRMVLLFEIACYFISS